jgi:hypothetical protein
VECLALIILLDQFPRSINISFASNQAEAKAAQEKIGHMEQKLRKSSIFYIVARAVGMDFIKPLLS